MQAGAFEKNGVCLSHAAFWTTIIRGINPRSVADWQTLVEYAPEVEKAANWLLSNWEINPQASINLASTIGQQSTWHAHPKIVNWLRFGLAAAEKSDNQTDTSNLQYFLAKQLRTRGQYDEAERLYRLSLQTKEQIGDSRSVAVTQSSLADLLRTRGQYDEAEALLNKGYVIVQQVRDLQGIGVFAMQLGQMALLRGEREQALVLFQQAYEQFMAIGLPNWAAQAEQLLAQAQGNVLSLDDLVDMVRAGRAGDQAQGQKAWDICQQIQRSEDATLAALGAGLQQALAGVDPAQALAKVDADLRQSLVRALGK